MGAGTHLQSHIRGTLDVPVHVEGTREPIRGPVMSALRGSKD